MNQPGGQQFSFPVPGRVLKTVIGGLLVIWLVFALGLNWGGAGGESFRVLTGETGTIAGGQIWRLLTAPLIHRPSGDIGHILGALIGLYFLGTGLEEAWGGKRFARFLLATGSLAYTTQFLIDWAIPGLPTGLIPTYYFGATPVVYAIAIAWAFSFKGRKVHLMMVLPVSSKTLIWIVVGVATMSAIALGQSPSGHVAVFAGMGFGYLLGGGSPSPLRRAFLKYRMNALVREATEERSNRKKRVKKSGLRVVQGGKDDPPPPGGMLH